MPVTTDVPERARPSTTTVFARAFGSDIDVTVAGSPCSSGKVKLTLAANVTTLRDCGEDFNDRRGEVRT
jgi:hypothetical protein